MQIQEATIHRLIKKVDTSGEGSVEKKIRPSVLPIDKVLTTVCSDLLSLYNDSSKNYGTLGQDSTLHIFPVRLNEYLSLTRSFQSFTIEALKLIKSEMESAYFSNGGYALFLRYQHDGNDHLLIAMLKLKPGAGVNEDTLSLEPNLNIDLSQLHEAARINLTRLDSQVEPYLSFIKGKRTKGAITEYFRNALSCQNFTSSSQQTEILIKAADAYVEARQDLTTTEEKRSERIEMRQRLVQCFASNSDEVVLMTLAASIAPASPQEFLDFIKSGPQAEQFPVNDTFTPHKGTYNKLKRFTGKIGGSVSVGFDISDIQEHRVYYDPAIDGLVLKSPTEHLKKVIQEYAPSPGSSS
ncbi:nucleoid-associated protein [Comamonas sp. JUb58]|uniref:nucleoid-associated protein n=1 Tax=Comamonas sp. JUb58 TaxID=2485114 RepID=UPI00105FB434|nr:nucleoid-associated protein [Comamonas sp. JUb58]TDS73432.1 nucleoid-associated protein [Comamonas sp. JUb58]